VLAGGSLDELDKRGWNSGSRESVFARKILACLSTSLYQMCLFVNVLILESVDNTLITSPYYPQV